MTSRLSNLARDAAADAIALLADGGTLKIYTGAQPANPQTAPSGTLLATLGFAGDAFGDPVNGVSTAAGISSDTTIDNSGTAGWFRLLDSGGNAIADGAITATGGGGQLEFDDVAFVAGATAAITSFTITVPM